MAFHSHGSGAGVPNKFQASLRRLSGRVIGCMPLALVQLHAIKTADIEQRLAKLEQQLSLMDGTSNEPTAAPDQEQESRAASEEVGETVD